jgi:hypothetical protein
MLLRAGHANCINVEELPRMDPGRALRHVTCSNRVAQSPQGTELMAIPNSRSLARPAKDEWGVYDPQQAGLAALFARLDKDKPSTPPVAAAPAKRNDVPEPAALPPLPRPTLRDAK